MKAKKPPASALPPPPPPKKVGFVLECGEDGADHQVLRFVLPLLRGNVTPVFNFAVNKGVLFRECAKRVEGLLVNDRCDRVFVVWDLIPPEVRDAQGRKSCVAETEDLRSRLRSQDRQHTTLLCISQELEAWLLTDGTSIEDYLSRPSHPSPRIADEKRPERVPNPKKTLNGHFHAARGPTFDYSDTDHAIELVKRASLKKYDRAQSFARLRAKLAGL